jgi:hypothetical protein
MPVSVKLPGRDHWGAVQTVFFAGGGVQARIIQCLRRATAGRGPPRCGSGYFGRKSLSGAYHPLTPKRGRHGDGLSGRLA